MPICALVASGCAGCRCFVGLLHTASDGLLGRRIGFDVGRKCEGISGIGGRSLGRIERLDRPGGQPGGRGQDQRRPAFDLGRADAGQFAADVEFVERSAVGVEDVDRAIGPGEQPLTRPLRANPTGEHDFAGRVADADR